MYSKVDEDSINSRYIFLLISFALISRHEVGLRFLIMYDSLFETNVLKKRLSLTKSVDSEILQATLCKVELWP